MVTAGFRKYRKGEKCMSGMMMDLVGQRCSIKNENEEYLTGHPDVTCHVLAADDEWIKIAYIDENGGRVIRMERIETLDSIMIFTEHREETLYR